MFLRTLVSRSTSGYCCSSGAFASAGTRRALSQTVKPTRPMAQGAAPAAAALEMEALGSAESLESPMSALNLAGADGVAGAAASATFDYHAYNAPETSPDHQGAASPLPPILLGTRVRKSPFVDGMLRSGVTDFTIYNKMILPTKGPQPVEEEYWKLVNNAVLWDVSAQRQIEFKGPDAAKLAQYLSSRNLDKFKVGQGKYVICTDADGTVINDPLVLKVSEDRFWFSIADRDLELWGKAHAMAQGFDVDIKELEVPVLAVQGPQSPDMLRKVFGSEVIDGLKFFNYRETTWHGRRTLVLRAGWSPERGYEIYPIPDGEGREGPLDQAVADAMWDELCEAGAEHGLAFGGPHQARRLESGMISSCDYEATVLNALELGLPKAIVNLDMKHDFVGKEALKARRDSALLEQQEQEQEEEEASTSLAARNPGADRLMVGIKFLDDDSSDLAAFPDAAMTSVWPIADDATGAIVGHITSIGRSPRVGCRIGVASIDATLADAGTAGLTVHTPQGSWGIVTAAFPFPGTEAPDHRGD